MKLVGIENPEERYRLFPHHFSGGMLQRAAIAVALSSRPRILFADEPTTSLDATIQTQILDLLRQMQKNFGTSTILVTHDLGAAAGRRTGSPSCTREKSQRSEQQRRSFTIPATRIPGR